MPEFPKFEFPDVGAFFAKLFSMLPPLPFLPQPVKPKFFELVEPTAIVTFGHGYSITPYLFIKNISLKDISGKLQYRLNIRVKSDLGQIINLKAEHEFENVSWPHNTIACIGEHNRKEEREILYIIDSERIELVLDGTIYTENGAMAISEKKILEKRDIQPFPPDTHAYIFGAESDELTESAKSMIDMGRYWMSLSDVPDPP